MTDESSSNPSNRFISFKDPATPRKIKEVAQKELGETEELKKECLEQIKTLIRDHGLRCITRDDFLLRFLRTKKFNVEASFKTLQNYADQRVKFHDILTNLRPEVLESCLDLKTYGFLPYRDGEQRLVALVKSSAWDMDVCSMEELVMVFKVFVNYASESESSQTVGMTIIWDHKELQLRHMPHLAFHIKSLVSFTLNCAPIRYKKVHFINENNVVKVLLAMVTPFMPKKLRERMLFHGDSREEFFKHFSTSILPYEFGGTLGPLSTDHLRKEFFDHLQKMRDEQQYFVE